MVGWLFARLMFLLLNKIPDDPFLEINFSLVLAFGSYLFVEEILHASGIVATTAAGITLASKAPLPISRNSQLYLNHLWSYLSFLATACIFLIVGLWIDLSLIWEILLFQCLCLLLCGCHAHLSLTSYFLKLGVYSGKTK